MLFAGGAKGIALDRERLCAEGRRRRRSGGARPRSQEPRRSRTCWSKCREGFPIALGVIYEDPRRPSKARSIEQNAAAASGKTADLQALVSKGQTWQVEKEPHKL